MRRLISIIIIIIIVIVLLPAQLSIPLWPDNLHEKFLRSYHGKWIILATDFSHFYRPSGERCKLWTGKE